GGVARRLHAGRRHVGDRVPRGAVPVRGARAGRRPDRGEPVSLRAHRRQQLRAAGTRRRGAAAAGGAGARAALGIREAAQRLRATPVVEAHAAAVAVAPRGPAVAARLDELGVADQTAHVVGAHAALDGAEGLVAGPRLGLAVARLGRRGRRGGGGGGGGGGPGGGPEGRGQPGPAGLRGRQPAG